MYLMPWVLKLVNRLSLFNERTREELETLHGMARARKDARKDDLPLWLTILLKTLKWTLWPVLLFVLVFLCSYLLNFFAGNWPSEPYPGNRLLAFVYLLLAIPFALPIFFCSDTGIGDWEELEQGPISLDSWHLYNLMDRLSDQLHIALGLGLIIVTGTGLFFRGEFSLLLLSYYYLKLVIVSFIFMSFLLLVGVYLFWTPQAKKGYLLGRIIPPILLTPFLLYLLLLPVSLWLPEASRDAIYLLYPFAFYFLFSAALTDFYGPLASLVIILSGGLVFVKIEVFLHHRQLESHQNRHRRSEFHDRAKKLSKELDQKSRWLQLLKKRRNRSATRKKSKKAGKSKGKALFIFGILLFATSVILNVVFEEEDPGPIIPRTDDIPYGTALAYNGDETVANETLELEQSLIINATVRFENVTLSFMNTENGSFGLYILEAGNLILQDCTLTSSSSFRFEVFGNISIRDSGISRLWGSTKYSAGDGGLELHGSEDREAVIVNSSISHCTTNGIMAWGRSLELFNSSFSQVGDDPVEVRHGSARIENCSFRENRDGLYLRKSTIKLANLSFRDSSLGIHLYRSSGIIQDCDIQSCRTGLYLSRSELEVQRVTIQDCRYGIWLYDSDPVIRDSVVRDIKDEALRKRYGSDPSLKNNDIQEPEKDGISDHMPLWLFYLLCAGIIVLTMRPFKLILLSRELEKLENETELLKPGGES